MDHNRFAPPTAEVADLVEPRGLNAFSRIALVGIALQLVFACLYAPAFFELVKVGVFSLLHFLLFILGTAFLIVGGLKLRRQAPSAMYWLGSSSFMALSSLLQSMPWVSITGAVMSVLTLVACGLQFKGRGKWMAKEPRA